MVLAGTVISCPLPSGIIPPIHHEYESGLAAVARVLPRIIVSAVLYVPEVSLFN